MKNRLYIIALFWSVFSLVLVQGCGVDPLDEGEKFGKTVCEDDSLPDTDDDGVNDQCEDILGLNKNSNDSDGDGILDNVDIGDPQTEIPTDCPAQDPNNYPPECKEYFERAGAKRNNVEDISRAGVLANSALNGAAPNGTKIDVQSQFIRVVAGTSPGQGLGTGDNSALLALCTTENNAPLTSFIYYKVVGTVKFCQAGVDPNVTQDCEGTAQPTMLELCGPISSALITNPADNADIVIENFKWTAGNTYLGKFTPISLIKDKENLTTLTLTPHDHQDVGDGVYNKMKVKFKKAFQVEGRIKNEYVNQQQGLPPQSTTNYVYMETDGNLETLRNFKRTGLVDEAFEDQFPKMLGPWVAGN